LAQSCDAAANEKDPDKFMELIEEIDRVLVPGNNWQTVRTRPNYHAAVQRLG
jgi:hypothetical protein